MSTTPRWISDTPEGNSRRYVERFRHLAASGADLAGEARLVDAMVRRGSRILDAGCGSGRTGAALSACGHVVVGVDVDPVLIEAARADSPGAQWLVGDLVELDLVGSGQMRAFDCAVLAGNVLVFVAAETEALVLERVRAQLEPDGFAVVGFQTDRYAVAEFDEAAKHAGFTLEHRFATWDLRPWRADSDFAVSVLRNP